MKTEKFGAKCSVVWEALDFQQKTHLAKEEASQWTDMQKAYMK